MRLRSLSLVNYRRYRDVHIEFPDGVFAIVGANGSGKSSLLEALGFALFGAQATRTPKAQLRHTGAAPGDPVSVVAHVELAGQALEVTREFRGVNLTAHASLVVDGKPLVTGGANSHAAVTHEVERLLGMDRTAFFTSIVAQQKELDRLAELNAADRKQLILRMLGIESLDQAIEAARARRRSLEQQVQDLREALPDADALAAAETAAKTRIDACQKAHGEADKAWQAAVATWQAAQQAAAQAEQEGAQRRAAQEALRSLEADVARLQEAMPDLERRIVAAQDAKQRAAALAPAAAPRDTAAEALAQGRRAHDAARAASQARQERERVVADLAALPAAPDPGDDGAVQQALADAQATLAKARETQAAARARLAQVEAHVARIADADAHDPCPFCDQPLHDQLPQLRARLGDDAKRLGADVASAASAVRAAADRMERAQAAAKAHAEARRLHDTTAATRQALHDRLERLGPEAPPTEAPDLAALEAAFAAADSADRQRVRALAQAEGLQELEAQRQARLEQAAKAQEAAVAQRTKLAALPADRTAQAKQTLAQAAEAERAAERRVHDALTSLRLAQQEAAHAAARRKEAEAQTAQLRKREADLRLWTALAGGRNKGLLEQFRSHLVGKIRPAINAEASRLLARFTDGRYTEMLLDDDYGVFVVDDGVAYALSRFSGGEADVAHLALRLAVSRLLTQRSGAAELRFLALDEVFGALDRRRRDAVLGALHGLGDLYSQVVLVTHQEDLREVLDAVLEVQEEGDASRVLFHHG